MLSYKSLLDIGHKLSYFPLSEQSKSTAPSSNGYTKLIKYIIDIVNSTVDWSGMCNIDKLIPADDIQIVEISDGL